MQADDVWMWCERTQIFGRTVTVKIKYADFKTATRSRTLIGPVVNKAELYNIALELVRSVYPVRMAVRLLGVTLSNFGTEDVEAEAEMPQQLSFPL